jgi:hypothetical protein
MTMLRLWKQWNDIIFAKENQQFADAQHVKLSTGVQRCYSLKGQLTINDRRIWFDTDIKEKLQEEPKHLHNWLMMTERLLHIARRERRK